MDDSDEQCPGRLLQQAAIYNNVELMESLLEGPELEHINAQDTFGRTALYTSVTNNSFECCRLLLIAGADPNIVCGLQCGGMTALHAAALDNKVQFVRLLLDHGADFSKVDASGEGASDLARKNRNYDCVIAISEKIEADRVRKENLHDEFITACCDGDSETALRVLSSPDLLPDEMLSFVNDVHPRDGQSLLYSCCCRGDGAMTRILIQNGADVTPDTNTGLSPFHVACLYGHASCVTVLLEHYPELATSSMQDGSYPLHLACASGDIAVLEALLVILVTADSAKLRRTEGVFHSSLNALDARRRTPLHVAVANNRVDTVRKLLSLRHTSSGATRGDRLASTTVKRTNSDRTQLVDVDAVDADGCTSLHLAIAGSADKSFSKILELLLQFGADPNKLHATPDGSEGESPLAVACYRGDLTMIELLLRHGACDADLSVMRSAVAKSNDTIIAALLQQQHTYADTKYAVNRASIVSAHYELDISDLTRSGSFSSISSLCIAIMVDWHALGLAYIRPQWLYSACIGHLRISSLQLMPEWLKFDGGRFASYLITRLDVSENKLCTLPSIVFQMPSLRVLVAHNNLISSIGEADTADDISKSFESMVSSVANTIVADKDFDCPLLEEIDLHHNQLSILPSWLFTNLPALRQLNASHNSINRLPFTLWTCTSLIELVLSNNRLSQLESIVNPLHGQLNGVCSSGAEQDLQPGTPASISSEQGINYWSSLNTSCTVEQPEPEHLDTKVTHMERWRERVQVKMYSGTEFDENGSRRLENKSRLKELDLSNNLFEEIQCSLACLAPSLERLNLSSNRLTRVGPIDYYPTGLRVLDLSFNKIVSSDVGPSDSRISGVDISRSAPLSASVPMPPPMNLRVCYSPFQQKSTSTMLSRSGPARSWSPAFSMSVGSSSVWGSPLAFCPTFCTHRQHRQLDRLRSLHLNNNCLAQLTFSGNESALLASDDSGSSGSPRATALAPKRMSVQSNTSGLGSLSADDRSFTDLMYFPNLSLLDLSNNNIESLPRSVADLSQLAEFKMSNNKIRELPPEMGLMKKLWYLDFSGCPVEATLRSLLGEKAKKAASVLGYLKSVHEEATLFNRMKLMFVGVQGIGKTSLLSQLRREENGRTPQKAHWTQRMYPSAKDKGVKGENISTVGVDIGDLVIRRDGRDVVFRTWDFGGQKEYYATHQYFLTKRSLYLVVWRLTDGERGVGEILRWLINIQARAPNSPVLIVGTHRDKIQKIHPAGMVEELGALVERRYMPGCEPDKLGLPRVLGHVEVSCRGGFLDRTIRNLADLIWRVATEEHMPGNSGVKLLEQKVPLSYIHLQVVVEKLAVERQAEGKDPVLYSGQYKPLVIQKMEEEFQSSFQDVIELSQATQFLHENGILLHYDDVSLQDYYFLDPQWLCDVLASVITIREINSLARRGVMKTNDIAVLFKGMSLRTDDIKTYIINLLQKFEVALLWDSDNLLIPSMLPVEADVVERQGGMGVMIPAAGCSVLRYGQPSRRKKSRPVPIHVSEGQSTFYLTYDNCSQNSAVKPTAALSIRKTDALTASGDSSTSPVNPHIYKNLAVSYVRLYIMSYFPCGFWPRLITRLLGDAIFGSLAETLYSLPSSVAADGKSSHCSDFSSVPQPSWHCWQTGVELRVFGNTVALRIAEISPDGETSPGSAAYTRAQLIIQQEPDFAWSGIDVTGMAMLEITVPNETMRVDEQTTLYPDVRTTAALITHAADRIDTLLEDWYPDVGIRFVQNTRGTYLITRLVPCMRCIISLQSVINNDDDSWSLVNVHRSSWLPQVTRPVHVPDSPRHSGSSAGSAGSFSRQRSSSVPCNRGIPTSVLCNGDRNASKRSSDKTEGTSVDAENPLNVYCYLIEQCIQRAQQDRVIFCPRHGNLGPYFIASDSGLVYSAHAAPDAVFQDIGDEKIVNLDSITKGKFLGKGAFGSVYAATVADKLTSQSIPVALKLLQPDKQSPTNATFSQQQMFNMDWQKWNRDPTKHACEAYLNARKELSILLTLNHDHIVPLLGLCLSPLCLVLSLAPLGSLSDRLREYQRAGDHLQLYVVREIILQVAAALGYLHSKQIIYRDLKSENVLVWSLPPPHSTMQSPTAVKLADYGVSRSVLPYGTKGFAGTQPFMAPEIIQHSGEEPYTEKVDCFSFGMFMYELLMLKIPYDGTTTLADSNINIRGHVLAGGRPAITNKELIYPPNVLDLMAVCWSRDPHERPSANEVVAFASRPEFCALRSAVAIDEPGDILCACTVPHDGTSTLPTIGAHDHSPTNSTTGSGLCNVWLSVVSPNSFSGLLLVNTYQDQECIEAKQLKCDVDGVVSSMAVTNSEVWCSVRSSTTIHIFRLSDYSNVCKFSVTNRPNCTIKCLAYNQADDAVFVVLDNGHFVVCNAVASGLDTSRVRTECPGNGRPIHCIAVRLLDGSGSELWCGQGDGKISIWNLHSTTGGNLRTVSHGDALLSHKAERSGADVVHLVADQYNVWSYVYPGTVVYNWDAQSKTVLGKVDLLEHLLLDTTDHKLRVARCQVASLGCVGDCFYIGTTFGYLVVVDSHSLSVVTILRPYVGPDPRVRAILPLNSSADSLAFDDDSFDDSRSIDSPRHSSSWHRPPLLVTIGRGYRDLVNDVIAHYVRQDCYDSDSQNGVILTWSGSDWPTAPPSVTTVSTSPASN